MEKFLVLYLAPIAGLEAWMQTDESIRKPAEEKMRSEWDQWMEANEGRVFDTSGAGKTKLVTADGVSDSRNDVMLYSLVEAPSHDEAAQMFVGHPHFGIPGATIEIMQVNNLGMQ